MGFMAAAPALWGGIMAGAGTAAGGTIGSILSSRGQTKAAKYQTDYANRAAELEAKSAQDALSFAREQEAERKKEWEATRDLNYGIWRAREANLRPFRSFGMGAIGQLAQPIPR